MTDVKEEIKEALRQALVDFGITDLDPIVDKPKEESHGDYSSNIAMMLWANQELRIKNPHFAEASRGRQECKNPFELAQKITDKFIIHDSKFMIHFEKVEAVRPGFINFWLSKKYLRNKLQEISDKKDKYGEGEVLKGKKIMVEFTDPNPFKEFHIGHLYSNTVGESISRLLEALGADLKRANYQGDVGMHIAKSLYAILQSSKFPSSVGRQVQSSKLENRSAKERAEFLGQCYAMGAKMYEEDESAKREIEQLNKKIYDKDPVVMPLYEKGRQWSLEYFETIYKRLGTKFDFYYFESRVGNDGLKLVKEYLKKNVFEESQGAVIFPGKKQGLHDRVFINSLGLPTYEAKELGLAFAKYQDFNFDQSIVITGNEIIGYFKVLLAAITKINPDLASKIKHLPHGMVRLPTGKMSSRTGNIVTGEWLLDEAKKLLKSKYSEMSEATLEKIAVGSVKYALLKSSIGHDIEFNFEESINIQGNSGTYLQYTFARTQSVLAKLKTQSSKLKTTVHNSKLESEEISLLRTLCRFSEAVESTGQNFAPNLLCNYLFDLAQKFNLFYQKQPILRAIGEIRNFRLALTAGTGQVLKSGLNLLGISAPEKM